MVMPASTITLGELQEYVKRQFGDESGVQILNTDIVRWVNMGAAEIASSNKILQASAVTTGYAGQREYPLDTIAPNLISIADVSYNGLSLQQSDTSTIKTMLPYNDATPILTNIPNGPDANDPTKPVNPISDYQAPVSPEESGQPRYWYTWGNNIKLFPVPNFNGYLSIDYIKIPERVVSSGELLPLPDAYYPRLVEFVMSKAYELDEDVPNASGQRSLFEQKLTQMSGLEETRSGAFPVIGIDYDSGYYGSITEVGW